MIFTKIMDRFKKPAPDDVNLLLIGPPSSGKTAIIYFLYRYAARVFKDYINEEAVDPMLADDRLKLIKHEKLVDFVNDIRREIMTSSNFKGTDPGSISLISMNTGALILRIYNISGELFTGVNNMPDLLRQFSEHMDFLDVNKTFALLCNEWSQVKSQDNKIEFFHVSNYFNNRPNAHNIFNNINNQKNTIRLVTKFDQLCRPQRYDNHARGNNGKLDLMHEPLYQLNHHKEYDFLRNHLDIYQTNVELEKFKGSNGNYFQKNFICTGMYDKKNFEDIYEFDPKKNSDVIRKAYHGAEMSKLEMYGIAEIFSIVLRKSPLFKRIDALKAPNRLTNDQHLISHADYRKILGL